MGKLNHLLIKNSNFRSVLAEQSSAAQSYTKGEKDTGGKELSLTPLIDCFSVLLIYLLISSSIGVEEIDIPKNMKLPAAAHSSSLRSGTVLAVKEGRILLNNKEVSLDGLSDLLSGERKDQDSIIIQADKGADYVELNPIVNASLQAGFTKIKFAVMQEDNG